MGNFHGNTVLYKSWGNTVTSHDVTSKLFFAAQEIFLPIINVKNSCVA